ncbi:hypothetical protein DWE35_23060 [Salmonella enterica]|nr:hypothetical protein [Salmonella enterica]
MHQRKAIISFVIMFLFSCIQVKSSLKNHYPKDKENLCLTIQVQLNQRTDIPKNTKLNFLFFLQFCHRRRKMIDLKKDAISDPSPNSVQC